MSEFFFHWVNLIVDPYIQSKKFFEEKSYFDLPKSVQHENEKIYTKFGQKSLRSQSKQKKNELDGRSVVQPVLQQR